jgi:hypothetical protein
MSERERPLREGDEREFRRQAEGDLRAGERRSTSEAKEEVEPGGFQGTLNRYLLLRNAIDWLSPEESSSDLTVVHPRNWSG